MGFSRQECWSGLPIPFSRGPWFVRNVLEAFTLWCWRRLLKVPWTARGSNQLILKEISPEYSLEGLMLKMKLWYFGHMMWKADSLEKNLMPQKIEGRRRRGQQRMRWFEGITNSIDMSFEQTLGYGEGQGSPAFCGPEWTLGLQSVGHNWATEQPPPSNPTAVYMPQGNHVILNRGWYYFIQQN